MCLFLAAARAGDAAEATGSSARPRTARNLIFVHLRGGPSHIDLWDPKDGLPPRMMSPFRSIETAVAEVRFTELLPRLAGMNDRFAVIRSLTCVPRALHSHDAAMDALLLQDGACIYTTGGSRIGSGRIAPLALTPCARGVGSDATSELRLAVLGEPARSAGSREAAVDGVNALCVADDEWDIPGCDAVSRVERAAYGGNAFGDRLIKARALIERGTRVAYVTWPYGGDDDAASFDVHRELTSRMRDHSGPILDRGLARLFEDLQHRDLFHETIVVAAGEFGRYPEMGVSTSGNDTAADGRDHWAQCHTAIIGGGPVRRGAVYGASDETGAYPILDPVRPADLMATVHHALGFSRGTESSPLDSNDMAGSVLHALLS